MNFWKQKLKQNLEVISLKTKILSAHLCLTKVGDVRGLCFCLYVTSINVVVVDSWVYTPTLSMVPVSLRFFDSFDILLTWRCRYCEEEGKTDRCSFVFLEGWMSKVWRFSLYFHQFVERGVEPKGQSFWTGIGLVTFHRTEGLLSLWALPSVFVSDIHPDGGM